MPPAHALRRIVKEIARLRTNPPDGIRIDAPEDNILDMIGIIKGPVDTPYEGGYFRIKFEFTDEFPASPPKCTMMTRIFHPNVSKAGEICVNTLKKDWKTEYGIEHILVTIKCLLIYPNAESALDEAAGKLLLDNYSDYCRHARVLTNVHATPRIPPYQFDSPPEPGPSTAVPSSPLLPTSTSRPSENVPSSSNSHAISLGSTSAFPRVSSSTSVSSLKVAAKVNGAQAQTDVIAEPLQLSTTNNAVKSPQEIATCLDNRSGDSSCLVGTNAADIAGPGMSLPTGDVGSSGASTQSLKLRASAEGGVVPSKRTLANAGQGSTSSSKRKKGLKRL